MAGAHDLAALYQATEQNLRYAIGVLDTHAHGPIPLVQVYQLDWDRELLAAVRDSLAAGLELVFTSMPDGTVTLHLNTREPVELRLQQDGQTFVLQAPAWDAELAGVGPDAAAHFVTACRRTGSYALLLRTPDWACPVQAAYPSGRTELGQIVPTECLPSEFEPR